jgi:hypothetical protein
VKKLVIVADTGRVRAFRLTPRDATGARAKIEELETSLQGLSPAPTEVTDDEGRFPSGLPQHVSPMRRGESHGRETEEERRSIREVAMAVSHMVEGEDCDIWNLAAPTRLCNRLVSELPLRLQERLTRVEQRDYTGLPLKEIERLFS